MLKVAKFAVAMALGTVAASALVAGDAQAAERRNQAASANTRVSAAFGRVYAPVDTAIKASNWTAADAALPAVAPAASTPFEHFLAAQLDYQIAAGTQNAARQATAINAMIDSNGAPAEMAPRLALASAQLSYQARNYAVAAQRAAQAIQLGNTDPAAPIIQLDALFRAGQADQGLVLANQMIAAAEAAGRPAPEDVYSIAARGLQSANRNADLVQLLAKRATAYPTAFNQRVAGIVYLQMTPNLPRPVQISVMRALLAGNAFSGAAQDSRAALLEHVRNLADSGLPNESLTAIRAAQSAGVVTTGDAAFNEVAQLQQTKLAADRAGLPASERSAIANPEARFAVRIGDAYLGYNEYAKAEALFAAALGKTGVDADQTNLDLGIARFHQGNMAGAQEAFGRVHGAYDFAARLWEGVVRARLAPATPPAPVPPATPAAPAQAH